MTERFEIGEVAIYVRSGSPLYGMEVTITSGPIEVTGGFDHLTREKYGPTVGYTYQCGKPASNGIDRWLAKPEWLRKKKPPSRECDQLTTWDKCDWQPMKVGEAVG